MSKKVDFCCCIGIKYEMRPECEKILENLRRKDWTFRYSIYNSKFPQYDQVIIISSGSRHQAHARGLLLCKGTEEKPPYFPKQYNLQYWVKEVSQVNTQVQR